MLSYSFHEIYIDSLKIEYEGEIFVDYKESTITVSIADFPDELLKMMRKGTPAVFKHKINFGDKIITKNGYVKMITRNGSDYKFYVEYIQDVPFVDPRNFI